MQVWEKLCSLKPAFICVEESEIIMKLPHHYVFVNEEIAVYEEKADVVHLLE